MSGELRPYTVVMGDTIHQLARRFYGDASFWVTIVNYNKLDYPYISTDGTVYPGIVAVVGTTLIIPLTESAPIVDKSYLIPPTDQAGYYRLILGVDLALVQGDLVPDSGAGLVSNGAGDLGALAGVSNLVAALQHRLDTACGELSYHPKYGTWLERFIGRPRDYVRAQLIGLEVKRVLLSDPRIESIADLAVQDNGTDDFDVVAHAHVIGQGNVVLNLVINRGP
jgi:phage baseplate assembly protein W